MTVLIVGGTARGRQLAEALSDTTEEVITSLAGRTARPRALPGSVRIGGFGGVDGLQRYLAELQPRAVVNATHPFAAQMSTHAVQACAMLGIPLLRLQAPSWSQLPQAADWHWADNHIAAAQAALDLDGSIAITVGRQSLPDYRALAQHSVVARVVDPPAMELPACWRLVCQRGPFALAEEEQFLDGSAVLISKDSGGTQPDAKLIVAAERAMHVIMVRRPPHPSAPAEVSTVAEAVTWLAAC